MIKNIVFDLGGVLLEFEPERYLKGLFPDGAKSRQLHEAIFQSELWLELDRGSVTTGEVVTALSRRNPGFQKDIALILSLCVPGVAKAPVPVDSVQAVASSGERIVP